MQTPAYDAQKRTKANTSALLRLLVAGYLGYLGGKIALTESDDMSVTVRYLLGGFFVLAAVGFCVYIWIRWQSDIKNAVLTDTEEPSDSADITSEDVPTAETDTAALENIRALYEAYIAKAEECERNRKPADGLLGFGKKAADDPCHDQFADDLEAALKQLAEQSPASITVCSVLEYIYKMPLTHQEPASVRWMLEAVQGLTKELIGSLNTADAAKLAEQYDADYPRRTRLPVQNQLYDILHKQAKQ